MKYKSKWNQVSLSLFNYQDDARSNKHKIKKYVRFVTQTRGAEIAIWVVFEQYRHCTYNVNLRRVCPSIVAMEKQKLLRVMSVCL